jgi:hypothetical protein
MITLFITIALSQNAPPPNIEIQAAMVLGAKTAAVQRKLPVANQVVLVPDEATYLDEISKWSPTERWPVLFNQEPKASQFIRRFAPEKVWIRDSVGKVDSIGDAMQKTVANAWNGNKTVTSALEELRVPPLGVVITSPSDTARTAAVALAAGRGQLLTYMSNDWGAPNETMRAATTSSLVQKVHNTLAKTGLNFNIIGDSVDAITFCMAMPARVNYNAASDNPVALTDVIGRDEGGTRFAWTGWIFGSKVDAAYMAMCSLFLDRSNYWFCNTYPQDGGWGNYGIGNTLEILPKYGIDCIAIDGSLASLQSADAGGVRTDVVYFTSKGNQDFLDMADERTSPTWLPLLDTPSALYFLHSWSLKNPTGRTTVGGTWLSRGVYAYVGSSHEPMLQAFVPQIEIMRRTMSLVPFLPAARWSAGESVYAKPWRVNTIGDPLMLCPPKAALVRTMIKPREDASYQDLAAIAQTNMALASDTASDVAFAKAIDSVVLLGKDAMACELWDVAMQKKTASVHSARAALGSLFRQELVNDFLWAFKLIPSPTRLEKDMLWQLCGISADTPLQLLINNLRSPYQVDDIKVIADRTLSQRGAPAVLDIIDKALQNAGGRNERELKRMRKQYDK